MADYSLQTEAAARIDPICQQFEAAWRRGERPSLVAFLADHPTSDHAALLCELIRLDVSYRRRMGERPSVADYETVLAGDAHLVAVVLASLATDHHGGDSSTVEGELASQESRITIALAGNAGESDRARADRAAVRPPRYALRRLHAAGGLGEVHVADDLELGREVALKRIKSDRASDAENRRRFLREAEITARLQHPGIVPVYGLVHDEAGSPCYAMRLIEGKSLQEALREFHRAASERPSGVQRSLIFRQLLRHLIDASNAVEYAHSRGVIHRDLKPGNIMLGNFGETLVVDWGLAKQLDKAADVPERAAAAVPDNVSHTLLGDVLGTPAYMSPEQAAGRWDLLGPAADVYSLGATLYAVLTGQAPFRHGDLTELLSSVKEGRFPHPRNVTAQVPRPLEAICLKAMSVDAGARYPSARSFAEDLDHWLADEPVSPLRESLGQRLARWSRRHRAWARSAIAALLMVSVVSIVAALLVDQSRRQEQQHRQRANEQAIAAMLAGEEALRSKSKAEEAAEREAAERAEAVRQAHTAEAEADYLSNLFVASDPFGFSGMGLRVGMERAEDLTARDLLDRGIERIESLADQPEAQAAMMDVLGNVDRSLGRYESAEELLRRSLEMRRQIYGHDHADVATTSFHLGWLEHDLGELKEAERLYREALDIRQRLFGRDDLRAAEVEFNLAWLLSDESKGNKNPKWQESEKLFREVLKVREEKLPKNHRDIAIAIGGLAAVLLGQDKDTAALLLLPKALAILKEQPGPHDPLDAYTLYLRAVAARRANRLDEAERLHRQAIEQGSGFLGKQHPIILLAMGDLAGLLRKKGDLQEAERTIREALAIARRSPACGHPKMIAALIELADVIGGRGELEESAALYREALKYCEWRQLPPDHSLTSDARKKLASVEAKLSAPTQETPD